MAPWANARPATINACHCDACKKLSGGTNLLVLTAPREAFNYTGEVQRYRRTADSGRQSDVVRCAACGVRLWHEPLSFPIVTLTIGTLDDPSWGVPASEIWIEKASNAAIFHSDAELFHGQVPREKQIAAFHALYGDGT